MALPGHPQDVIDGAMRAVAGMTAAEVHWRAMSQFSWRDRECRFDIKEYELRQEKGEILIDHLGEIEDTKGNNGQTGRLLVTNLRLIWVSDRRVGTNLSIGYSSIISLSIKWSSSKLQGRVRSLYVLAKHNNTRYQFIFTNCVPDTPRLFTTIQAVHRAFETSKLYRPILRLLRS